MERVNWGLDRVRNVDGLRTLVWHQRHHPADLIVSLPGNTFLGNAVETTTMTTKGQVTIPKSVRQQLGLKQGSRVAFVVEGDHAVLRPASPERALPKSGFGMVKVSGPALPADFDVASLLKPATSKAPEVAKRAVRR